MFKVSRQKMFCVFFILCLVFLMLLIPIKNKANANEGHFIMIEEAFEGVICVQNGGVNQDLLILENAQYSLLGTTQITIIPAQPLLIKIVTPNSYRDYEPLVSETTYREHWEYCFPSQIYIKPAFKEQTPAISYTVTFLDINEEILKEQTVQAGQKATAPSSPIEEGLVFVGWDTPYENITQDITIRPIYQPIEYDVQFYIEGQNYITTIQHGQKIDINSDFYQNLPLEKDLHSFIHFYKLNQATNEAFAFSTTPIQEDLTLVALFEKTQCLITYIKDGEISVTQEIGMGALAEKLEIEDCSGKYFLGWRKEGQAVYYDFSQPVSEDITLVAHMVSQICTVTYIEEGQEDKIVRIEKNTKAFFIAPIITEEFIGWQTVYANNVNYDFEQIVCQDLILFAVYEKDITTVIIDLDGGSAENYRQEQIIRKGFDYIMPEDPEKEGFTFAGWDVSLIGNVKTITALYVPNLTVTYYVQYPFSQASIAFVATNLTNNSSLELVEVYEYDEQRLDQSIIMLQKGWEFLYWHQEGEEQEYTNATITSNLDLYAKIRLKKYPVHFYYEEVESVVEVEHGQAVSEFDIPNPKEGNYYVWKNEYDEIYDFGQIIEKETFLYAEKFAIMLNVEYRLTIEQQDFSYIEQIEYGKYANVPQLSQDGYTISWYCEEECCQSYDFALTLVTDTIIYGMADPNLYNITIDLQSDYGLANKIYAFYYNETILLDAIDEYGYLQSRLFYHKEDSQLFDFEKMPAYDIHLYAILQKQIFTIDYKVGENIFCQEQYEYLTTITLREGESNEEENFYCWKDSEGNEYYGSYVVTKDITLIAEYTPKTVYIVTFQKKRTSIEKTVIEGNAITSNLVDSSEIGYTFCNWYSDENHTEIFDFDNSTITENITIYGKYQINVYKVTFLGIDNQELSSMEVEYDKKIENWLQINYAIEGYTFCNWYSDENHTEIFDFYNSTITENITIYGKYQINVYKVTFLGIDNQELGCLEVEYNNKIENWHQITTALEGYTFKNWFADQNYTDIFDFQSIVVKKDITIYGKYQINVYNINFVGLNGKELAIYNINYNEQITNIESINTIETGYDFIGWYVDEECNNAIDFEDFGVKGNCTFYAKYAIKNYKIILYGQDEEQLCIIKKKYNQMLQASLLPIEEKTGYDFVAWYSDSKLTVPFEKRVVNQDISIYARYQAKTFTVVFMGLDEEVLSTCTVEYGESALLPSPDICNINGYAFEGFDSECDKITEDTVINAIYLPIVYMDEYGNVLDSSFAPPKEGYTFLGWNQIKENGVMNYVPRYEQIDESGGVTNPDSSNFFNRAILDIILRVAMVLILFALVGFVKIKKPKN